MNNRVAPLLALAAALSLGACELRRDSDKQPATDVGDTLSAPSSGESAAPVASIIRDDQAPEKDAVLPTAPVDLVVPFPDNAELDESAERRLAGLLAKDAVTKEDWPIVLGGHTDAGGNGDANLRASRSRAEAVAAWLVERGVEDSRIRVIAFGEQNPIAPNALPDGSPNEKGRRTNRRVEIRVAPPAPEPKVTPGAASEGAAKAGSGTSGDKTS